MYKKSDQNVVTNILLGEGGRSSNAMLKCQIWCSQNAEQFMDIIK